MGLIVGMALALLCTFGVGVFTLFAMYLIGLPAARQKHAREAAKLLVDQLRAARLKNDLAVVENRAHKLSNDVVLGDLKIEEARRKLGLTPHGDSPSW